MTKNQRTQDKTKDNGGIGVSCLPGYRMQGVKIEENPEHIISG
jgi:hypothetical protein